MQEPVLAWLLHPGDPLPPIATERGVLCAPAGPWWLRVLGTAAEMGKIQLDQSLKSLAVLTCIDERADVGHNVARALGVWTGASTLPCCVVAEPGGSVAGAWTGADLGEALQQALEALRGWQA